MLLIIRYALEILPFLYSSIAPPFFCLLHMPCEHYEVKTSLIIFGNSKMTGLHEFALDIVFIPFVWTFNKLVFLYMFVLYIIDFFCWMFSLDRNKLSNEGYCSFVCSKIIWISFDCLCCQLVIIMPCGLLQHKILVKWVGEHRLSIMYLMKKELVICTIVGLFIYSSCMTH